MATFLSGQVLTADMLNRALKSKLDGSIGDDFNNRIESAEKLLEPIKENGLVDSIFENVDGKKLRDVNIEQVESIADLAGIAKYDRRTIIVRSYHKPIYAEANPCKGGGLFIYDASKVNQNDGILVFNGWVRVVDKVIDIYQAGAKLGGFDCSDILQAALNTNLTVEIPEGEFIISKEIKLKDGQTLQGRGRKSVLKLKPGSNTNSLLSIKGLSYPDNKIILVTVKNLMLYSDEKSTGSGIDIKFCERIYLDNVIVRGFEKGVHIDSAIQTYLKQCSLQTNTHGLYTEWTLNESIGSWVFLDECYIAGNVAGCTLVDTASITASKSVIVGNSDYGLAASTTQSKLNDVLNTYLFIEGCDIDSNDGAGVRVIDLTKVVITNNWVSSGRKLNQSGIHIVRTPETVVSNNQVHWCGGHGIVIENSDNSSINANICTSNQFAGILLDNSKNCIVSNNSSFTKTGHGYSQQYGIKEAGTADKNIIIANNCHDNYSSYEIIGKKTRWLANNNLADIRQGATSARPNINDVEIGTIYFDTTLFKPIWRIGDGWVDATGTTV